MVLDATPNEATSLTSLPSYNNRSAHHRISILGDQRLLNTNRSQRKLQFRPSHPALLQQQRLDNDATQLEMKRSSVQPATLQPKKSSSSLFNLFSKPKVEKARGYGGEAASTPALPQVKTNVVPLKPAIKTRPPIPPYSTPPRPPSQQILSQPTPAPHTHSSGPVRAITHRASVQRLKPEESGRGPFKQDKNQSWVAPPLFQAFARSIKHGLCETSIASADKHAARLKAAAREKELEDTQTDVRDSLGSDPSDGTHRAKMTVQTTRGFSTTHVELPQKIVVLLDDGHLLQYSQHGSTNRLPEKVLLLGPESATHVSDATSVSPGALRIVQNSSTRAFSLQSTVNALSRLTRRSMNPKRDVPNLLLAFRTAEETHDWQQAIRALIERTARPTSVSSKAASEKEQVDSVVDDSTLLTINPSETSAPQPTVALTSVTTAPEPKSDVSTPPKPIQRPTFDDDSDDSQRKGSLEMVEEEAEKLLASPKRLSMMSARKRTSDAPSYTSSLSHSMDSHVLNNLRNSARMSGQTNLTSRTSSMISEPSSNKPSLEDSASIKSPYRNLSSYQAAKRRSALPATVASSATSAPIIELTTPSAPTATERSTVPELSLPTTTLPVTSKTMPAVPVARSPVVRSPPMLSSMSSTEHLGQDSTPTIAEEDERPESIVADLPPPSTWTSKLSPKKRSSLGASAPPSSDRLQYRYSSAPLAQTTQQAAAAATRRASHGFRIPLKINPNVPAERPASRTKNRNSDVPEALPDTPKVFTLEAKVDPKTHRMSIGQQSFSSTDLKQRTSQRLSLFPSPLLPQGSFPDQTRPRTTSVSGGPTVSSQAVPARNASLQRPASLQVRSTNAPFLASARSPAIATAPVSSPDLSNTSENITPANAAAAIKRLSLSSTAIPIRAAPIRQLKPSRSASAISTMSSVREYDRPASPTDPFTAGSSPPNDGDTGLYIPPRRQAYRMSYTPGTVPPSVSLPMAPIMPMGNSFAQQSMSRRTSMRPRHSIIAPVSDIEALGPPAPPPNAPLPAPPDGAPPGILSLGTGAITMGARTARMSTQGPPQRGLGIRI